MAVAPTYATAVPSGAGYHIPGDMREGLYTGTVGASDTYATGGFAITAAQLGLNTIIQVQPIVFSTGHWGIYDSAAGKIKVFTAGSGAAAPAELANTSAALQSATFTVRALGV